MPMNFTLKNIPDEVYRRLKDSARLHRRSMNSEAIVCLETVLHPTRLGPETRLVRARQIRASLSGEFPAADVDTFKKAGRP